VDQTANERTRLAYDPQLGGDVLFGGIGPSSANTTLWLLASGAWSSVSMHTTPKPQARIDAQLVWDETKQAFMVFAGVTTGDNGKTALSDTWIVVAPPISISPNTGKPGTKVTITSGPWWPTGKDVDVYFQEKLLKTVTPDSNGLISTPANVPSDAGKGDKSFKLVNATLGIKVTATFNVTQPQGTGTDGPAPAAVATVASAPGPLWTAPQALRHFAATPVAATGQVTAHDGQFWLGSTPILLHGLNASPIEHTYLADADYAAMASWNMNFVRMRVHWSDLETSAPIKVGNTWTHAYDAVDTQALKDQIGYAAAHGEYVLIENAEAANYPPWLFQSPYNSHGKNYADVTALETDYWNDALMKQFTTDFMVYLAGQLKNVTGVVGYEPIDEPDPGDLTINHTTTQLLLDVQNAMASAIRAADPPRVVFFTTHDSLGAGLPKADLSKWKTLGNVAFDVHDYFGGRWGSGLNMNPSSSDFGESTQALLDFTLNADTPPYLGITASHIRFVQVAQSYLTPKGIPLFVGEFCGKDTDPNALALFGTMTQAFNLTGVAWTAWSYDGNNDVFKDNGAQQPWVSILSAAAKYPR
jgi:hypothetical protein